MSPLRAARAEVAFWIREVSRDEERVGIFEGTPQEAKARADVAESRAKLAEAQAEAMRVLRGA